MKQGVDLIGGYVFFDFLFAIVNLVVEILTEQYIGRSKSREAWHALTNVAAQVFMIPIPIVFIAYWRNRSIENCIRL